MPDPRTIGLAVAGLGADDLALADRVLAHRAVMAVDDGLDAALEHRAVDVVWLGAGPGRVDDARRVVASGRALLLSGPPASDLDDLDELDAIAREPDGRVAVVHRRDSPPFARAAADVASGRLGLPRSVLVHLLETAPADGDRQLFEAIDAVRAIVGLEPQSAYAAGDAGSTRVTIVELERDVPATVVTGESPGADPVADGLRRIVLVGSQGMLAYEEDRPRLDVRGAPARAGDGGAVAARAAGLVRELTGLVRDGRPPVCGLSDARPALAALVAARAAARAHAVTAVAASAGGAR